MKNSLGIQFVRRFVAVVGLFLALALAPLELRAQGQQLSEQDLNIHLKANSTLLGQNASQDAARLDNAVQILSRLSEPALSRVLEDPKSLSASEKLSGLVVQKILERAAAKRGMNFSAATQNSAAAIALAKKLGLGSSLKLDGKQLLSIYKTELSSPIEKLEVLANFDKSLQAQIETLNARLPELFDANSFRIADPVYQAFLRRLSVEYFSRLPEDTHRKLLLDALKADSRAATPQIGFEALFRNAGPQYQKLLQIVAREEGLDPEFAKILKTLESSVPESPFAEVDRELRARIPSVYPEKLRIVREKPIGAGTLAQTYSAVQIKDGLEYPVALRVLRPNIAERVRQENMVFETITPLIEKDPALQGTAFTSFGMIWKRISENVDEELHVDITAKNQNLFQEIYSPQPKLKTAAEGASSDLRVPKVYMPELAAHGVLVQEFVEGISFEKLGRENPDAARAAAHDFASLWLREALFLSGHHHSDPHQGNLRVAQPNSARPQVYLLDYGMIGTLSQTERADMMLLGYSLQSRDLKRAVHHALRLTSDAKLANAQLIEDLVAAELEKVSPSAPELLEKMVTHGEKIPRALVSFNRGYFMVSQLLRQTDSAESLAELTARMGIDLIGQDVMKRIVGWGKLGKNDSNPSPLPSSELWRIARKETRNSCTRSAMRLFGR